MSATQILLDANNLLYAPHRWTKGAAARNLLGEKINLYETKEVPHCFDAHGALIYATLLNNFSCASSSYREAYQLLCLVARDQIIRKPADETNLSNLAYYLWHYNDNPTTTYADVVKLYSCALPIMHYAESRNTNVRRRTAEESVCRQVAATHA